MDPEQIAAYKAQMGDTGESDDAIALKLLDEELKSPEPPIGPMNPTIGDIMRQAGLPVPEED